MKKTYLIGGILPHFSWYPLIFFLCLKETIKAIIKSRDEFVKNYSYYLFDFFCFDFFLI